MKTCTLPAIEFDATRARDLLATLPASEADRAILAALCLAKLPEHVDAGEPVHCCKRYEAGVATVLKFGPLAVGVLDEAPA